MIWFIIGLGLLLDQLTKLWVAASLPFNSTVSVLGNFFGLRYIHNDGAAWSLLAGKPWLLTIMAAVIVVILAVFLYRIPRQRRFLRGSIALVIAGALGNLIDRVRLGYVVDFFQLPHWPVFNVADCLLVVGVIMICIVVLFGKDEQKRLADSGGEKCD